MNDITPQPTAAQPTSPRSSKKGVAFGLTAGLVGGSLAGLMLGVPGLTNAAADDALVTAAQVEPIDETPADVPADIEAEADTDTDTDAAPVEMGDRLRELLQELVDDGTLTSAQADSVTTHLVENQPARRDHGRRGPGPGRRGPGTFARSGVLTDLLGIEADELREQLRAGSTLAEIAEANGVETSAVVDALVAQVEERLDAAVEADRITADEAAEKLAELTTRIDDKINGD